MICKLQSVLSSHWELLKAKASPDGTGEEVRGKTQKSPLLIAMTMGLSKSFKLLLAAGATRGKLGVGDSGVVIFELLMNCEGTELHDRLHERQHECLELLLKVDVAELRGKNLCSVLIVACQKGCPRMAETLLRCGVPADVPVDISFRGSLDHPLMFAVKNQDLQCVKLLLEHRADPRRRSRLSSRNTPLSAALPEENKEIISLLRKALGREEEATATLMGKLVELVSYAAKPELVGRRGRVLSCQCPEASRQCLVSVFLGEEEGWRTWRCDPADLKVDDEDDVDVSVEGLEPCDIDEPRSTSPTPGPSRRGETRPGCRAPPLSGVDSAAVCCR